jgi:hypothetical protein
VNGRSVRQEHEKIPLNVLVGFHAETVVTITTETVDPPPHEEEVTVREDAPERPDEGASQAAWDNYAQRSTVYQLPTSARACRHPLSWPLTAGDCHRL